MGFSRPSDASLRLLFLLASLIVITAAAYLIRDRSTAEAIGAMQWVSHTHEVRAAVFEMKTSVNAMEVAAASESGSAGVARLKTESDAFAPLIDRLRELTADSPQQQERVGMLRVRSEGRIAALNAALSMPFGPERLAAIAQARERFPVRDIADAMLNDEEALIGVRSAAADRSARASHITDVGVTLAQIFLLGSLIWLSDRQLRRRVVAERETRDAVERARLIVETVREPIAVVAPDLSILQTNEAFANFYGLDEAAPPRALADIGAWTDASLLQRLRDVAGMRRELWDYEVAQRTKNDTVRHVSVNARPMIPPGSDEAVTLLMVSDLTARKYAEEQVLELNRQLEGKIGQVTEVNRELEAFSYSVSHDLRAPLRHISGFADKLRVRLGDDADEKSAHYCKIIAESAQRMSALIEDLLSYSRLGRNAMRLQPIDMQSLIEEVRSTLMSGRDRTRATWRVAPLPVVVADGSMMRLAWQNLLENALKYSANVAEPQIEVGYRDEGDTERVFWVKDNGAGFDMKYADKLFGVFQRLHKASEFAGTGIGLASVRRIVARHGGRTWAEGVPAQGATFYFSLPRLDGKN